MQVCVCKHLEKDALQLSAVFPTVLLREEDCVRWDAVIRNPAVALQHPDHNVWKAVLRLRHKTHCQVFTFNLLIRPTTFWLAGLALTSSAIVLSLLAQSSACSSTKESSVSGPCFSVSAAAMICCRWRLRMCLSERSRGVAHCHWSRAGSSSL